MTSIYIDPDKILEEYISNDQYNEIESTILMDTIDQLKGAALQFSHMVIDDARTREKYIAGINRIVQETLQKVEAKELTAQQGATYSSELRNIIMNETRAVTSSPGRIIAETMKKEGLPPEYFLDKYAKQNFGKNFTSLTEAEKSTVYLTVINKSGVSRATVSTTLPILARLGRVCALITVGLALNKIITAENKKKEAFRQVTQVGGGAAGTTLGAAVGAKASVWLATAYCGPYAPICIAGAALICGLGGGWIGQKATTSVLDSYDEELNELFKCPEDDLEEFLKWEIF